MVSLSYASIISMVSVTGAAFLVIMALVLIALAAVGIGAIACDW